MVVSDINRSKKFYHSLLGLEVVADFGANVVLSSGVALQQADAWYAFIDKQPEDVCFGGNAFELYFETDKIEELVKTLNDVELVHPLKEHRWGQRVIRFYDPDRHIIEVGEEIPSVVRRFLDSGMTHEQVASHMEVPLSYVLSVR